MQQTKSNFKKFLLLWLGELISTIGGGLTSFGLGVYIFQQTGSAASMALITLAGFLPTLLLSIPAGVLADRYDRRILMMIGDGCSALGIIYILICMLCGTASVWQIGIGVFVSAVFSSLLEPAYRATVTDLLTKEEYSKASGMVSIAGSARYLVSPILAGLLLSITDIKVLLIIDICTFFLTVASTMVVKKSIITKEKEEKESIKESMKQGWKAITCKKGLLMLIIISSLITFFMGTLQILAEPLILDFKDSVVLGVSETICALGMLVSGVYLGIKGIKKSYTKILSISLIFAGIAMIGFGLKENIYIICIFGFFFFAALPFANNCLDYLVRTNVSDKLQGRVWGIIGFLSQIGYVLAYSLSGFAADFIAKQLQIGVGRGAAIVIIASGVLLSITSLSILFVRSIKLLEKYQ